MVKRWSLLYTKLGGGLYFKDQFECFSKPLLTRIDYTEISAFNF